MAANLVAEDHTLEEEQVAGSRIAISSYRLGNTVYAKP